MTIFFTVFLGLAALCLFIQSACYLRNRHADVGEHESHSSRPYGSGDESA